MAISLDATDRLTLSHDQCGHDQPADDDTVREASAVDLPAPVDLPAIEDAVRQILAAVGEDPEREGLLETPRRVAKMYAEMFSGLHLDPARHLRVTFPETYDEIVLVRDITFTSMCEHHLLPFTGSRPRGRTCPRGGSPG